MIYKIPGGENFDQDLSEKLAFLNGFALNQKMTSGDDTFLRTIGFARKEHRGQVRKDGSPYISHPVDLCITLINYGISNQEILGGGMTHDVSEECRVEFSELRALFGEKVADIVRLVSHFEDTDLDIHFSEMRKSIGAALVKTADQICIWRNYRQVNIPKKVEMKKEETITLVLPMIRMAWEESIEYKNNLMAMAQHLIDLVYI